MDEELLTASVARIVDRKDEVMVIKDSLHEYQNTLDVLQTNSSLVSIGKYFIVDDGDAITDWMSVQRQERSRQLKLLWE